MIPSLSSWKMKKHWAVAVAHPREGAKEFHDV
jgi:hypothetical protein